jgi:hypothetical protein
VVKLSKLKNIFFIFYKPKLLFSYINWKKSKITFVSGVLVLSSLFTFANIAVSHAAYGGTCSDSTVTQTTDPIFGSNVEIFNPHSDNTTNTTCSFVVPTGVVAVDYFVVGGGGGGSGGGGGGGGVVTNREVQTASGIVRGSRRASLSVNAGDTIAVSIGHGGGYCGGGNAGATGCSPSGVSSTDGGNTSFGSIIATGGGGGGQYPGNGRPGGSSGGAAADNTSTSGASPSSSTAVGATSLGNAGGASGGGSYAAGAGGGGAGSSGGNARSINYSGDCATAGCGTSLGGGGNGGVGVRSDILTTGTFTGEFGCGGGGGINNNTGQVISGAGGGAGCSNAGAGSSYGTRLNLQNNTNHFNGGSGTSGTGGGGGGTDPEDSKAGTGGSGIVIISYLVEDTQCPNDHSASPTSTPLACNYKISIVAGGGSRSIDPRDAPVSYSNTAISTATQVTTIDSVTISVSSNTFIFLVSDTQSSLVGGTYPMLYKLTQSSVDKYAYVLVNVADPNQHTPSAIPVDPRASFVDLPKILVGTPTAVLVCIIPQSRNYTRLPNVTLRSNVGGTTNSTPSAGGLRMVGTRSAIQSNLNQIRITPNASDTRVVPGTASRYLSVNVSNTTVGGNNSCFGGTSSTIELYPIKLTQIRSFTVLPKNGRQNN